MALNTANRRSSAVNVGSPWRSRLPFPDGAISQPDRQHVALLYEGIAAGGFVPPEPEPEPSQRPAGRKRRRRYIVSIDGRDFEVDSAAEALNLLERAKAIAQKAAAEAAKQVLRRKVRSGRKPTVQLRKPEIRTDAPVADAQLMELRQEIAAIYDRAAVDAEIGYLFLKLLREEQDEEDALIVLLS